MIQWCQLSLAVSRGDKTWPFEMEQLHRSQEHRFWEWCDRGSKYPGSLSEEMVIFLSCDVCVGSYNIIYMYVYMYMYMRQLHAWTITGTCRWTCFSHGTCAQAYICTCTCMFGVHAQCTCTCTCTQNTCMYICSCLHLMELHNRVVSWARCLRRRERECWWLLQVIYMHGPCQHVGRTNQIADVF